MTPVPIDIFLKAERVFNSLGWDKEEKDFGTKPFDIFCETLSLFSEEQQDLLVDLTLNYLYFPLVNYLKGYIEIFTKIEKELDKRIKKFYLLPLLPEDDIGRGKSGVFIVYHLHDSKSKFEAIFPWQFNFIREIIGNPPLGLPKPIKFNVRKDSRIVLLDDFIGTGKTAERAVNYLVKKQKYRLKKIIVVTLVSQKEGLEYLQSKGIKVYTLSIREKGISDYYGGHEKELMVNRMEKIEEFLHVDEDYRFGYGRSEALVTLKKTPNNTFPVYWYQPILKSGEKFKALFNSN